LEYFVWLYLSGILGETALAMEQISIERAQIIAKNVGLVPGRVKGTEGVQFTKGSNNRLNVITWDEFVEALENRGLAIYASGTWMKIMKKSQ